MSGGVGFLPSTVSPVEQGDKKPASNPCNVGRVTPERTKVVPADAKAMQQWRMSLGGRKSRKTRRPSLVGG